jgi:hypothetical protein
VVLFVLSRNWDQQRAWKMKIQIKSVGVLTGGALRILRREARRARREKSERLSKMTTRDLFEVVMENFASIRNDATLPERGEEVEQPLQPLPPISREQVGKYEDPPSVALLLFAQANPGKIVLVKFSGTPSKAFTDRLRESAKSRNLALRSFHLIGEWAAMEVNPRQTPEEWDVSCLKSSGVR